MDEQLFNFYEENKDNINAIIDIVVSNHPDILDAKKQKEDSYINEAFNDFLTDFPDEGITNVSDFDNMENSDAFIALLEKGLSFKDAYKLLNFNSLIEKRSKTASMDTANKLASKQHLKASGGGVSKENSVPSEVMDMYKALIRDWSEDKIKKHYNMSK